MKREIIYLNENSIITADSIPDLDEWGVDDFWSCSEWIQWHQAMMQKYGQEQANLTFANYWNQQGFGAHALGCRTVDPDFRNYIQSVGLYETVWRGAGGLKYILQPIGAVMQTGSVVGTSVTKGLQTAGMGFRYLVPLALVAGVIGLGVFGYRMATRRKV